MSHAATGHAAPLPPPPPYWSASGQPPLPQPPSSQQWPPFSVSHSRSQSGTTLMGGPSTGRPRAALRWQGTPIGAPCTTWPTPAPPMRRPPKSQPSWRRPRPVRPADLRKRMKVRCDRHLRRRPPSFDTQFRGRCTGWSGRRPVARRAARRGAHLRRLAVKKAQNSPVRARPTGAELFGKVEPQLPGPRATLGLAHAAAPRDRARDRAAARASRRPRHRRRGAGGDGRFLLQSTSSRRRGSRISRRRPRATCCYTSTFRSWSAAVRAAVVSR